MQLIKIIDSDKVFIWKKRKKVIQGQFAVLLNISGATRCSIRILLDVVLSISGTTRCSIRILVVLDHFRCY